MKKTLFLMVVFIAIGCGSDGPFEASGVWSRMKTYNEWKEGKNELITSTEVGIGSMVYYGLTNSVVINTIDSEKYFAVPGGRWIVANNEYLKGGKSKIIIMSTKKENTYGELFLNFVKFDSIYFEMGVMDKTIKDEMEQAFIFWGAKEIYQRCDRK